MLESCLKSFPLFVYQKVEFGDLAVMFFSDKVELAQDKLICRLILFLYLGYPSLILSH